MCFFVLGILPLSSGAKAVHRSAAPHVSHLFMRARNAGAGSGAAVICQAGKSWILTVRPNRRSRVDPISQQIETEKI